MKKSLIALAVAGAFAAPAFAATSNVDVYGVMNIALEDRDSSGTDLDVVDNVSRIGFKGSEDLGGGLKAIWQIEQGINATSTGPSGPMGNGNLRNTFVGLAGGFGTAVIGRHDTPYKMATGKYDIFGDTIADYNGGAGNGALDTMGLLDSNHDARAANAVAYISPNFSGFTVAAAVVTARTGDHLDNGDTADAYSLAGMYANGPLTVDVAYQDVDTLDSTAWKLGAGYAFGDTKVGFVYEDVDNDAGVDRDSWLLNVVHTMGPIALKAMYGQADVGTADQDQWALGADYMLSKRTTAYIVYSNADNDVGSDEAGWNLGMKHSF